MGSCTSFMRPTRHGHAIDDSDKFLHPMVLISAATLVAEGRLRMHEELRKEGKLLFLDSRSAVEAFKGGPITEKHANHITFISHQWLAWNEPDPDNSHFDGAVYATKIISKVQGMDLSRIYVWMDYVSIPQRHRANQQRAIESLPEYASLSHCLMVVAPDAKHADLGTTCNELTYRRRGWCRAEVFAKICGSGTEHSFLVHGPPGGLEIAALGLGTVDFLGDVLAVFEGDFTCCHRGQAGQCDRERLRLPMRHLYHQMLKQDKADNLVQFTQFMQDKRDQIFPRHFTDHDGTKRDLFVSTRHLFDHLEPTPGRTPYLEATPEKNDCREL